MPSKQTCGAQRHGQRRFRPGPRWSGSIQSRTPYNAPLAPPLSAYLAERSPLIGCVEVAKLCHARALSPLTRKDRPRKPALLGRLTPTQEVKLFPGSVGHLLGRRPLCPQALSFDGHSLMHRRVGRKLRLQYYLWENHCSTHATRCAHIHDLVLIRREQLLAFGEGGHWREQLPVAVAVAHT